MGRWQPPAAATLAAIGSIRREQARVERKFADTADNDNIQFEFQIEARELQPLHRQRDASRCPIGLNEQS